MSHKVPPIATVVHGHTFTVDKRYVLKDSRILGKGSFGVVCTAYDSIRKIDMAIKRIRPYANDDWDARHTLREIRLLKLLGPHPNIISIYELSLFEPKTELYMMMELMDCDLHRVIQSKQALTEKHHKCFLKQMLEGIKAMHAIGVFHRDLKPGNLLVSKDCQLRITDFGLARFMDENTRQGQNEVNPMTEYVVTRWYRCPELLLAPNQPYSEAIDLWSIGCIFAELLRRKPLFPGKSHTNQVQLIFDALGYSNPRELGFSVSPEAASFLDKRCRHRKQPMKKYVPDASDVAVNLLEKLLSVDPSKRPSAVHALEHAFLRDAEILNDYSKTYLSRPSPTFFEFEHSKFSVPMLKRQIEHEVELSAADGYRYKPVAISSGGSPGSGSSSSSSTSSSSGISSENVSPDDPRAREALLNANAASAAHTAAAASAARLQEHNITTAAAQQANLHRDDINKLLQQQQQQQEQYATRMPEVTGSLSNTGYAPQIRRTSTSNASAAGDSESDSGPASQLPTQIMHSRVPRVTSAKENTTTTSTTTAAGGGGGASNSGGAAAVRKGNPFRSATAGAAVAGTAAARPRSTDNISEQAAAYRQLLLNSRSSTDMTNSGPEDTTSTATTAAAATAADTANNNSSSSSSSRGGPDVSYIVEDEVFDPIPLNSMPAGENILTAVRNEAVPYHIPPGSRTKTPKSPSPKKVGEIMQKDLNNKRRFLMQQEGIAVVDQAGETNPHGVSGGAGSAGSGSGHIDSSSVSLNNSSSKRVGVGASNIMRIKGQQSLLHKQNLAVANTHSIIRNSGSARQQQQQGTGATNYKSSNSSNNNSSNSTRRLSKLIPSVPVPFPVLTGSRQAAAQSTRNSYINNAAAAAVMRQGNTGGGTSTSTSDHFLGSSSYDQHDAAAPSAATGPAAGAVAPYALVGRSKAMMQGGSNVINR